MYELIRLWRANPFSHILPKIFLRSDLIRAKFIKGVNSTEIFRKSISIEWTTEELFAYFFGLQLDANIDLYAHFERNLTSHPARKKILEKLESYKKFAFQIPAEKEILEPLVNIFFGYAAHKTNSNDLTFNSSYDWFAYHLQDGNNDLSLRPFLWLLEGSKTIAMADENYQLYSAETNTILGARYFADSKAMEYAGAKYYDELELEQGNDVLKHFRQFLRAARSIKRVGTYELREFHELLTLFIQEKQAPLSELNMANIQKITSFLQNNGIIREKRIQGGKFTTYEIPFLYKYYLLFDNA